MSKRTNLEPRLIDPFDSRIQTFDNVQKTHAIVPLIGGFIITGLLAYAASPLVSAEQRASEAETNITVYAIEPTNINTRSIGAADAKGSFITGNPVVKVPIIGDFNLGWLSRTAHADEATTVFRVEGENIGDIQEGGLNEELNAQKIIVKINLSELHISASIYEEQTLITNDASMANDEADAVRNRIENVVQGACKIVKEDNQACLDFGDQISDKETVDAKIARQLRIRIIETTRNCLTSVENTKSRVTGKFVLVFSHNYLS